MLLIENKKFLRYRRYEFFVIMNINLWYLRKFSFSIHNVLIFAPCVILIWESNCSSAKRRVLLPKVTHFYQCYDVSGKSVYALCKRWIRHWRTDPAECTEVCDLVFTSSYARLSTFSIFVAKNPNESPWRRDTVLYRTRNGISFSKSFWMKLFMAYILF